jgi:ribosomal protein L3
MGDENMTLKNVSIVATHNIDGEDIVVVKGSVPGSRNSLLRAYLQ